MKRLLSVALLAGVTGLPSCSNHQRESLAYGPEIQTILITNSAVEGFNNGLSAAELPNSFSTNISWMRREGVDLGYFLSDGVFGVDMKLVQLKAEDWSHLRASDLVLRLGAADGAKQPKDYLNHSAGPSVYGFQTRAGTIGLLEVLSFTDNPRVPKYRYKLVKSASSPNPQTGANGRLPVGSGTNQASVAAASRRSP